MNSTATSLRGHDGADRAPSAEPTTGAAPIEAGSTWTVSTTAGYRAKGYLPSWADEDPSEEGVPLDRLPIRLIDIRHCEFFDGQSLPVRSPAAGGEAASRAWKEQVLWGNIVCSPYAEDPGLRIPVANVAVVDDYWISDLDPEGVAALAAALRAQADRLDHEVHPRLIAIRADWEQQHTV
ncbi:DUF6907 domain-containing protein [Streptomyces sp. NBC_01190]|uniref:DUF6907 domain-containing protein n=1 Tax=Streptomyces sp. NBC_01190 TaxID=2903767 RepID=UPI003864CF2F|nr:hypothetical protein OG519_16270 [Streptomyces sp. NBC_01190]